MGTLKPGLLKVAFVKLWGYVGVFVLASMLLALVVYAPLEGVLKLEALRDLDLGKVFFENLTFTMTVLLCARVAVRLLDRRPWGSLGFALYPKALWELGLGIAVGAGLLLGLWLVDGLFSVATGADAVVLPEVKVAWADVPAVLVLMLFVAFNEELLIRGFPLQMLVRTVGAPLAVALTSLGFGLLHLTGDAWNATTVVLDTGFSGILFAMAYLKTKSLWMPMGIHFSNNFIIFLFENPALEDINLIPPEQSQTVFFGWWLVNFPLYLMAFYLMYRWPYRPNETMKNYFDRYVRFGVAPQVSQTPLTTDEGE